MLYCEALLPYLGFIDDMAGSSFKHLLSQIANLHSDINNVEQK